jgi:hypothetical protein
VTFVVAAPSVETTVSVIMHALPGTDDPNPNVPQTTVLTPRSNPPVESDAHLSLPTSVKPGDDGSYDLAATVTGLPTGYAGGGTLTLGGLPDGATVATSTTGCTASGAVVTCTPLGEGQPVALHVSVPDDTADTPLTVALGGLDFTDTHPDDNTAATTLTAAPAPAFQVAAGYGRFGDKGGTALTVSVTGSDAGPLTFSIKGKGASVNFLSGDCGVKERDVTATCQSTGPRSQSFQFTVDVQKGQYDVSTLSVDDHVHTPVTQPIAFAADGGSNGSHGSAASVLNRALAAVTDPTGHVTGPTQASGDAGRTGQQAAHPHHARHHRAEHQAGHHAGHQRLRDHAGQLPGPALPSVPHVTAPHGHRAHPAKNQGHRSHAEKTHRHAPPASGAAHRHKAHQHKAHQRKAHKAHEDKGHRAKGGLTDQVTNLLPPGLLPSL